MRLRVGAKSDIGHVREMNEDAYLLRPDDGLFVVCDGMGGAPAGEVASQMAVDALVAQLGAGDGGGPDMDDDGEGGCLRQTTRLADAVRRSNAFIYQEARRNPRRTNMGTTLVGAWIAQHIASVAHVGDSRAYLWHDQRLEPLTRDHSLVEAHVTAGLMDRDESMKSEQQNILLRVLGREPDVEVEVNEVPVQAGDYLLLCSDGLTRMVPEAAMAGAFVTFRHPQEICDHLIETANRNGGADNVTVIVVEVLGAWWRNVARRWIGHA
jgi:protein phosphatase